MGEDATGKHFVRKELEKREPCCEGCPKMVPVNQETYQSEDKGRSKEQSGPDQSMKFEVEEAVDLARSIQPGKFAVEEAVLARSN